MKNIIIIISKLGLACYAVSAVKPYILQETIRIIYFSYFHSLIANGINFCGNSPHNTHIFRLQKRIIRIITNTGLRTLEGNCSRN
jgi:hypothetical protein